MPEVTKPVPIDESSDVVHDDTTGGTDGNPHTLSAELDDTGVLRAGQLPDLAVTNTSTVTAQSDLTGLDAEQGDVAIVTDDSQAYILTTDDPTVLGNWVVIKSPPAPVDDVFGRTGSVSPQSGDYSASEIANFASSALSAIDAEIDAAATSVSGLDNVTNTHISAGNPHSGSADTNHGNEAHAESYITSGEAPVQSVNGDVGDVTVGGIPSGLIAMWSGSASNVPSGWTLCDGSNGTPDLRDRFVVGAGNSYDVNDTGGQNSVQLLESEMPNHGHTGSTSTTEGHTHDIAVAEFRGGGGSAVGFGEYTNSGQNISSGPTRSSGSHNHDVDINAAGGDGSHENRPPYYALAYIMKT